MRSVRVVPGACCTRCVISHAMTTTKAPAKRGLRLCAEEDSNLHPLSVDQAPNLVTRASDPFNASIASRSSGNLDALDAMDDLDVAADVATGAARASLEIQAQRA